MHSGYFRESSIDAVLIITEWDEYKKVNWKEIISVMRKPTWIFDTRKIILKDDLKKLDINFWQIGTSDT